MVNIPQRRKRMSDEMESGVPGNGNRHCICIAELLLS